MSQINKELIFNHLDALASQYCTGCRYNSLSQYKHSEFCLFKTERFSFYLNKVVCKLIYKINENDQFILP